MTEKPQQYGYVVTWDNNEEPIVVAGNDFLDAAATAYAWISSQASSGWPIKSIERIGRHA